MENLEFQNLRFKFFNIFLIKKTSHSRILKFVMKKTNDSHEF